MRVEELVEVEVVQVEVEVAEVEVAERNHQPPHVSFFATTTAYGEQHPLHMRPPSFPSRAYLLLRRASLFSLPTSPALPALSGLFTHIDVSPRHA